MHHAKALKALSLGIVIDFFGELRPCQGPLEELSREGYALNSNLMHRCFAIRNLLRYTKVMHRPRGID